MSVYPSYRYHPEHDSKVVKSLDEDASLTGWFHSPAEFGIETQPGVAPDPTIFSKRIAIVSPSQPNKKSKERTKA